MTVSTGKRSYRACDRCRRRKIKCDLTSLGEEGRLSCSECRRSGHECTLPPSRRGGNYSRYRASRGRGLSRPNDESAARTTNHATSETEVAATTTQVQSPVLSADNFEGESMQVDELRNPSDALQILARTNSLQETREDDHRPRDTELRSETEKCIDDTIPNHYPDNTYSCHTDPQSRSGPAHGIENYKLVAQGLLDSTVVLRLIELYAQNYHDFAPIVPKHVLEPSNIDHVARHEPFLLTAIMTIASKNDHAWESVHRRCWDYMQELLLDVLLARPHTHRVGLVEGLLLLSDWLPSAHSNTPSTSKSLFAEDATAWSLIGQAVRHSYLLRLDRTSFRECFHGETKDEIDRKRLVWTFVYIADRQISVRLGQAFWSRGPSLSSKFTAKDFPTLQASSTGGEDHASVLHATMELTQLLHNAHDILYSSHARTQELILAGDYNRYLDDFQKALLSWNQNWHDLASSPRIKCVLILMYEYLCLYVNAFAFQARVTSMAHEARDGSNAQQFVPLRHHSFFSRGIMATPEGRYIFEALRAAKAVLRVMGQADPVSCIRYMPTRYYLYSIYSAVFLYKANTFGAFSSNDEKEEVARLVQDFIAILEQASTTKYHIAWRYSKLLGGLSFQPRSTILSSNRGASDCGHSQSENMAAPQELDHLHTNQSDPVIIGKVGTDVSSAPMNSLRQQPPKDYTAVHDTSIPSDPRTSGLSNLEPFDFQSTPQTNAFLEALFGTDNANFVPPFSEDMMF